MKKPQLTTLLWIGTGLLALAMLFARVVFAEYVWLSVVLGVLLLGALALLVKENRAALKTRSAAYGLNSAVTIVLVLGIVGVVNFLASRYPGKLDLTQNKVHTLSDQTVKLIKGLDKTVKVTLFSKMSEREKFRPLLDDYRGLNPKFEVEYVDPDREPTRAKEAGIKRYGTLVMNVNGREDKIDDPTEEKLTNALIKLTKDKTQTLCAITGHGEKSFDSAEADGYSSVKKALGDQDYTVKNVNLVQDAKGGKVPPECDAIAILGPTKSFFPPEVKAISDFLDAGGRAIIAIDVNIKGGQYAPELLPLLAKWHIKLDNAMVVDPFSTMLGVDASVPILANYSKDNPITKDFQANCYFPLARPVEVESGAPAGMNVQWLAQTTPRSWQVNDLKELASGHVKFTAGKDKNGPLTVAAAASGREPENGKGSKATRDTRLVVFGTSNFATNNYSRFGGNVDFFLNAASWVMQDENLISIRAREEGPGKVELSQKEGSFIFLLTVIVLPLLTSAGGIGIWAIRRRL